MPTILSQTTSFCPTCGQAHKARYEIDAGAVFYTIACPIRTQRTLVSSDPKLFTMIRQRADFDAAAPVPGSPLRRMAFLEITDACNFNCPICYAQAGPHGQSYLTPAEARERLGKIKAAGGRWVSITGGEATLHPQLLDIVRIVRREFGMVPLLITNGLRLAQEPDLAPALRRAGLAKVQLQFDTFRRDTYLRMRGRDDLREKFDAIENIRRGGLRLGLVATLCRLNLDEVGALLDLAVSLTPRASTLILQAMAPVGRWPADLESLDRETLLHALARQGKKHGLELEDFWPTPPIPAWKAAVHPDCPVHLHLRVHRGTARPLGRDVDLARFFGAISRGPRHSYAATLWLMLQLMRRARAGQRLSLLRSLWGAWRGRGRDGLLWVSLGGYMLPATRDDQRLARCPTGCVTRQGVMGMCERSCLGDHRPLLAAEETAR